MATAGFLLLGREKVAETNRRQEQDDGYCHKALVGHFSAVRKKHSFLDTTYDTYNTPTTSLLSAWHGTGSNCEECSSVEWQDFEVIGLVGNFKKILK